MTAPNVPDLLAPIRAVDAFAEACRAGNTPDPDTINELHLALAAASEVVDHLALELPHAFEDCAGFARCYARLHAAIDHYAAGDHHTGRIHFRRAIKACRP